LDDQKRRQPGYVPAKKQLSRMKKGYYSFFQKTNKRPLLTVAGGAGVGKTYNLQDVLDNFCGYKAYDEREAKAAEENGETYEDYDYVFAPQINSVPKLAKFLNKFPDKIIVFDDNDALLTDPEMSNIMKNLCDGNPKNRKFPEYNDKEKPTGKNAFFSGKLVVLTNKSMDTLNRNEDAKAVMSRGNKQEINFTVQENIDTLRDRYKTMKMDTEIPGLTVKEEQDLRDEIFDFIVENKDKLDPSKFTVRKFSELYDKVAEEKNAEILARTSADAAEDFEPEDWHESALDILNKAEEGSNMEDNYNVAFNDPAEDWSEEEKRKFDRIEKKLNKKRNKHSEEDDDEDSEDEETAKAIFDEMSLSEAEDLLFNW
jgi:hypothetical protein